MSNPRPILLIANFANRVGGGEDSFLTLVQGLNKRRFLPHVIVPKEGEIFLALDKIGVPAKVLSLPPVRPWTLISVIRALIRLRQVIKRWGITLVHTHGSRGALYANLAVFWLPVPVVWHVRVVDRDPWLDGFLLRLSKTVVTNSNATASRFVGNSPATGKIHVIYNGVDSGQFRPGPPDTALRQALGLPPEGPVILFAGRLEYAKGPDLFLEAALHVHKQVPGTTFLFAGEGPMRIELEATATAAGIPAVFVGHQQDMSPVFHLCAVVVMPSRQEAFGRVLIEAMAAEVPVIAARVGGIPEVCQDGRTGLLVSPENPPALAAAIVATLTDREATRSRVVAAAEDVRMRFSLESHVDRIMHLYSDVLSVRHKNGGHA